MRSRADSDDLVRATGQPQDELALADRTHFVTLSGLEVDQAGGCQRSLAGAGADQQLAAQDEHERVLVNLVLL